VQQCPPPLQNVQHRSRPPIIHAYKTCNIRHLLITTYAVRCLLQSSIVPRMITAAVDILGGVGSDYVKSGKCSNGPPAAFLKMHGVKDPFITYDRQVCEFWPDNTRPSEMHAWYISKASDVFLSGACQLQNTLVRICGRVASC
jgi:hypothetical protein